MRLGSNVCHYTARYAPGDELEERDRRARRTLGVVDDGSTAGLRVAGAVRCGWGGDEQQRRSSDGNGSSESLHATPPDLTNTLPSGPVIFLRSVSSRKCAASGETPEPVLRLRRRDAHHSDIGISLAAGLIALLGATEMRRGRGVPSAIPTGLAATSLLLAIGV
jgi:hypothetical protein